VNYIWHAVIQAERGGIPREELQFVPAEVFSPYMELSSKFINSKTVEDQVEVNPYYRFQDLFQHLFDPNYVEDTELRHSLFDLLIHFLADIDRTQGMNKREFHIRFAIQDAEMGLFGDSLGEKLRLLDRDQRDAIFGNLLRLYESGEALYLLKDTVRRIFPGTTIYSNSLGKDELIFYMSIEESEENVSRIQLILELFLPLHYTVELYWRSHFGIIGVDDSMKIDQIALY
jgi:hypothetical protein